MVLLEARIQTPRTSAIAAVLVAFILMPISSIGQTQQNPANILSNPVPPKVVLPAPSPSTEPPIQPITAEEAARVALRLNKGLKFVAAGIEAARGRTDQTKSATNPTLGFSLTYSKVNELYGSTANVSGVPGVGGLPGGHQAGVTIRQLLFDFDHTRQLIRQDRALETVAEQGLSKAQHDLVWQVKVAFYQFSGAKKLVAVYEDNVANRQRQRDLAMARWKSGVGLPSDVVTAESALVDAILGLQSAQNGLNQARVNLLLQMGVDTRTPLEPAECQEQPIDTTNLNSLVETAMKRRPELLQADANVRAVESGLKAAKSTNAPVIVGLLGALGRGSDSPISNDTSGVGFAINFTPFDGGLTKGRVREAKANIEAAVQEREAVRQQIVADISQAYLNLKTAEQQVATSGIGMQNTREGVRIAEGRYRAGLGLFLDIVNAQALLLTTTISQAGALSAVKQSTATLNRAIGGPLPAR